MNSRFPLFYSRKFAQQIVVFALRTIFLLGAPGLISAQSYTAKTFRETEGLPSNHVFAINQLEDGRLIAVTKNGVCAYDGLLWETLSDTISVPNSHNSRIVKKEKNTLWLAGFDNKHLVIGSFRSGIWHQHSVPFLVNDDIYQYTLSFDYCQNKNGEYNLLLGVRNELYLYESETKSWTALKLPQSNITDIFYDVKFIGQKAYILTNRGIFTMDQDKLIEEVLYDFPNKTVVKIEVDTLNDCFYLLGKNWLGRVRNDSFHLLIQSFESVFSHHISSSHLYLSENGRLFFGLNSMIYFLDQEGKDYNRINLLGQMEAFWHNSIFVDREQNIWVSSNRGMGKISNLSLKFFNHSHGILEDEISGLAELPDGKLIVGSNYSLVELGQGHSRVLFRTDRNEQVIYRFSNFLSHNNQLYFTGYQKGIGRIGVDGSLEWIAPLPMKNKPVNSLFFLSDSMMVISENQIYYWNGKSYELHTKCISFARRAVFLKDGSIWIATSSGIQIFRGPGKGRVIRGVNSNYDNVTDVIEFNNTLYAGTYAGLGVIKEGKIMKVERNSMVIERPVFELFESSTGTMWAGTDDGVFILDEKGIKRHLNNSDGLIGNEINRGTIIENRKGEILIGTVEGLAVYNRTEDIGIHEFPIARINSIKSPSKKLLDLNQTSHLSSTENGIEIEFGGITLSSSKKLNYRYRLRGYEDTWNNLKADKRTAINYVNLPGGSYIFDVEVMSGLGTWSTTASSPVISISKPFYKTIWFTGLSIVVVLLILYFIYRFSIQIKLIKQKELIEIQHETIRKSMRYAKRIQESILPSNSLIDSLFPENFVFYLPKDIVAGDFYWFSKRNDKIYFAVADCTGHGVPGALVGVVCSNALNYVVNDLGYECPAQILEKISEIVVDTFSNDKHDVSDGMDVALCLYDQSTLKVHFAGAHNSLFRLTSKHSEIVGHFIENENKRLIEYKGNSRPVGKNTFNTPFARYEIQLEKGDVLFLSTDGYYDQFGGMKGKKMMKHILMNHLLNLKGNTISSHKSDLETFFATWKGENVQVDDVCLIGIKI